MWKANAQMASAANTRIAKVAKSVRIINVWPAPRIAIAKMAQFAHKLSASLVVAEMQIVAPVRSAIQKP